MTAGSPYYNPHVQRPALFPPLDGYLPPEDPLAGVARQIDATARLKAACPSLVFVGSGYTYLQEWLPHVAERAVRDGLTDFVGLGRMVLSYPDLPADVLSGAPLKRKAICRTFSECTTGPRLGLVSGCYPLDEHYTSHPDAAAAAGAQSALAGRRVEWTDQSTRARRPQCNRLLSRLSMILSALDWTLMLVYFAFVLGIGFMLKRYTRTSADFFQAGRALPAWVCGLAFLSANLGAQEIIGMAASGAKYGIATSHFYWVGAIPAMVFLGIFMMPFYYGSRARSVPEYLRLRFDEKTRAFNAVSFALMTVCSSGISMYAMAKLLQMLHILDAPFRALGWDPSYIFHTCIASSALVVLAYILFGGLSSAIYNEVLQFFLIVAGFLPLVYLGLRDVGGWSGLVRDCHPR